MKSLSTLLFIIILSFHAASAQDTLRVLFLGNSYTAYNNLPQLVQSLSTASGKTLIADWHTPGGMTIAGHTADPVATNKINQGIWDYVVVQEQSQIPSINHLRYNNMYPALTDLKAMVEKANPCTRIITYMTWGRRFGGRQCDPTNTYCSPVFTDFNHMQDSLTAAYMDISDRLHIQCAPVGVTWQNILNDTNLVLHINDNSHPNADGSYVAALTIYSAIWKLPAKGNTFTGGLTEARALYYQRMSDSTVFRSRNDWNLNINVPQADFRYAVSGKTVNFTNTTRSDVDTTLDYHWDLGDGNVSKLRHPVHTYATAGTYTVRLMVNDCRFADTVSYAMVIATNGIFSNETFPVLVYPNPTHGETTIDLGAVRQMVSVIVRNTAGQEVLRQQWTNVGTLPLNIPGESGVYLVEVTADNKRALLKVIRK